MSKDIGIRLKMLRNVARMSQKEFAEVLGVSPRSYERWEQGKRLPEIGHILQIADKLQISTDWLLGRENCFAVYINNNSLLETYLKIILEKKERG